MRSHFGATQQAIITAAKRPRADIDASELAGVLSPFVSCKRWLAYPESTSSATNKMIIASHKGLLQTLHRRLNSFAISSMVLEAAFLNIAQSRHESIGLHIDHTTAWSKATARRLRVLLRHFTQALVKRSSWTKNILDDDTPAKEEKDDEEEEEEEEALVAAPAETLAEPVVDDDDPWIAGFNWEHCEAWRARMSVAYNSKFSRETTKDLFADEPSAQTSIMKARWPDGVVAELPDLMLHQWEAMQTRPSRSSKAIFSGVRKLDSNKVRVVFRAERPGSEIYRIYDCDPSRASRPKPTRKPSPSTWPSSTSTTPSTAAS